ncbi:MAG: hypothetical protein ABIQ60_05410 [Burkholderiaceae bacterium]
MRYRIALCGFSDFEYRAMHFSFEHRPTSDEIQYEVVDALAEADFAVVDADSPPAVKGVVQSRRVPHAVFVGSVAPGGSTLLLPRPIDPTRILRMLDALSVSAGVKARAPAHPPTTRREPPAGRELPVLDEVIPAAPPGPAGASARAARSAPAGPAQAPSSHSAKTVARAAARRARLVRDRDEQPTGELLRDVMVLDPDEASGTVLCVLLERFGFSTERLSSIDQALEELDTRAFAAFFLTIALDPAEESDGLGLLQRIQSLPALEGYAPPAVLIVTAQLRPADRVRATLAGVGEPLIKPVSRGDVARALERCGVPLPADSRRV